MPDTRTAQPRFWPNTWRLSAGALAAGAALAAAAGARAQDLDACVEASRTENGTSFICAARLESPPPAFPAEFRIGPMESLELRFDRPHHVRTLLLSLGCSSANAPRPQQKRALVEVATEDGVSLRTALPDTGRQRIVLPRWARATGLTVRLLPPETDASAAGRLCVTDLSADLEEERAIEFQRAACEDSDSEVAREQCLEGVVARIERESEAARRQLRVQYQGRGALLSGLADAQRDWERWRDAECDLRSARFGSGTGAGNEDVRCRAELGEARLWQLRELQE